MIDAPATMLLGDDPRELPARLLALPDSVVLSGHLELREACRHHRQAAAYLAARLALLSARRDPEGRSQPGVAIALVNARMGLVAAARRERGQR